MAKKDIYKLQNGSDIRGVACEGVAGEKVNLTNVTAYKLGAAFCQWLSIKYRRPANSFKIGIGRDSRITGQQLAQACGQGVESAGAAVIQCGLATTPAMFMSVVFPETSYDGAIMVTASHLPFNRNGLKFFDQDGCLDHEDITIILEMASEMDDVEPDSKTEEPVLSCLMSLYSNHLKNAICKGLNCQPQDKPLKGLKIVVDAGNGDGGFFVDNILGELGADTTGSQFLEPDGRFPNHIPNPENKEAMLSVRLATTANNADLGLIFDTDVDRMSAVFADGTEINRDLIIALMAAILAPENPGSTIVTDSVTSDRLTHFLQKELGLVHYRFVRGYKNVINKQRELNESGINCPLAMETSGHGALKENYYLDDGAFLAVKLIIALALAKKQGKTLESYIEKMPRALPKEEAAFRFTITEDDFEDYGKIVLDDFEQYAFEQDIKVEKSYEGVRLRFDDSRCKGWILLRLSLHDPVMPLNIEGENPGNLEKLKKIALKLLNGFDGLDISSLENSIIGENQF